MILKETIYGNPPKVCGCYLIHFVMFYQLGSIHNETCVTLTNAPNKLAKIVLEIGPTLMLSRLSKVHVC